MMTTQLLDLLPELPSDRFGSIAGRHTFRPGELRPEWFTDAALRQLPGRNIRWANSARTSPLRAMASALERTRPAPGEPVSVLWPVKKQPRGRGMAGYELTSGRQPGGRVVTVDGRRRYVVDADQAVRA